MSHSHSTHGSSAGLATGVKTAALILVLGVIALIADVSLVSPRESVLPYPPITTVDPRVTALPVEETDPMPKLAMINTARAAKPAPATAAARDPSVPAASDVVFSAEAATAPTF